MDSLKQIFDPWIRANFQKRCSVMRSLIKLTELENYDKEKYKQSKDTALKKTSYKKQSYDGDNNGKANTATLL